MKSFFTLILLLLNCGATTAQHRVVDAETNEPVPFALIYNKRLQSTVYTNEDGSFKITPYRSSDTLIFSCMSHNELTTTVEVIKNNNTVSLSKKQNILGEVVVSAQHEEKTIPYLPKKMHITFGSNMASEMAIKLNFPEEDHKRYKQITEARIRVKQASENNPVRIHIYDVREDGMPGKDLLQENIILSDENISWGQLKLDVSKYNVYTSQDAVFVSLEWLGGNEISNTDILTSPRVRMTDAYPENLTYIRMIGKFDWRESLGDPVDFNKPVNLLVSIKYK